LKLAVGTRGQAIVLKDMLEYLKAIPGTKKLWLAAMWSCLRPILRILPGTPSIGSTELKGLRMLEIAPGGQLVRLPMI
jgi:hypothetical protein